MEMLQTESPSDNNINVPEEDNERQNQLLSTDNANVSLICDDTEIFNHDNETDYIIEDITIVSPSTSSTTTATHNPNISNNNRVGRITDSNNKRIFSKGNQVLQKVKNDTTQKLNSQYFKDKIKQVNTLVDAKIQHLNECHSFAKAEHEITAKKIKLEMDDDSDIRKTENEIKKLELINQGKLFELECEEKKLKIEILKIQT